MRSLSRLLVVLTLALTTVAGTASAATFGAEVFGAWNTYAMEDQNDAIDTANSGGADFNNITNGLTGGLGLRLWANESWMFSGTWEPLFLETEDSSTPSGTRTNLDANSFQLTSAYFFPTTTNARYGLGAGVGHYSIGGESQPSGSPALEITGSTVGFHFMGMTEWRVNPGFTVHGSAGYRVANVDKKDIEVDGTSPAPYDADYSGFMGRVGMAFYMPSSSSN